MLSCGEMGVCGLRERESACALGIRRSYKRFYFSERQLGGPRSEMDEACEVVGSVQEESGHKGYRKRCDERKERSVPGKRAKLKVLVLESFWDSFRVRALLKTNSLCCDMKTCEPAARTSTSKGSPWPYFTSPQHV